MTRTASKAVLAAILLLIVVGTYARFTELGWHFTNVDDRGVAEIILENRQSGEYGLFPIPRFYTYAPLQFLLTDFLIRDGQSYRELLFWGRLPSALAGILGMLVLAAFFRFWKGRFEASVLPALALLACSWENIIHAKQMHNYALGVAAVLALMCLLLYNLKRPKITMKSMILSAAALAFFGHAHYQVLAMTPAFFLTLFLKAWPEEPDKKALFGRFLAGGLIFLAGVFPMWFYFLRTHLQANAGAPLTDGGPSGEFIFSWPAPGPWMSKALYTLRFFVFNFILIFESNTAFLPESHPWLKSVGILLFVFFLFGVVSFVRSREPIKRSLGVFMGAVALTWMVLILGDKIHFGPTRHALILLPMMALTIAEGWAFIWRTKGFLAASLLFSAGIAGLFCAHYGTFLDQRRDPFVESEIVETMTKYNVDAIATNVRSDGLVLMRDFSAYRERTALLPDRYRSVAWLSRSDAPKTLDECEQLRRFYNLKILQRIKATGRPEPMAEHPCTDYERVYSKVRAEGVQTDFSSRTHVPIYTNEFYFYIFRLKSEAA